jgi:hypothetical protein
MIRIAATAALLALTLAPAAAQGRVQTGVLECRTDPTVGFIIGSVRSMDCVFRPRRGRLQYYRGSQARVGFDVGLRAGSALVWAVFAPTVDMGRGELAGNYAGVSADAAVGLGVGANALVGGSNNTIALQPLSVEGQIGANLAVGVSGLTLTYER